MHSHLIPGIDDGVRTPEEALQVILEFKKLGYTRLITTPHVMSDSYRNTTDDILQGLTRLRQFLKEQQVDIAIDAAAEYYLDEALTRMIAANQPLLTFGKNYLLFETNFLNEPLDLKEFIFMATAKGYKLVLAHPERYIYLQSNPGKIEDLLQRGVLMQVNIASLTGYYSKAALTTAQRLIDQKMVHFLASDCHSQKHLQHVADAQRTKYFQKALNLPLLNNSL
jgi:tyrosine-protein phosphatase YwqE